MFPLHCILHILYTKSLDKRLIIRVKGFPLDLSVSQDTFVTDRQTNRRTTYDNPCHKHLCSVARQKLAGVEFFDCRSPTKIGM